MNDRTHQPRADRQQLQQIIAGLNDGVILINPDQTIAWANERALTLHGVGTLTELGATVEEFRQRFVLTYRNKHKLPPGAHPMERLLAGEAFSEVVVHVTQPRTGRHWTHQIRTLVLTDPHGRPDCLVMIVNDETERFDAEERFERAFNANPAPAIIARLSDMRYVRVNRGFLELTGMESGELVGRSMMEFDVLHRVDQRDLAVKRLHAHETIPQMEGCLALPGGRERTVLLGGQPIEIGDQACMLFTFADLHPRQMAQHALKHSEERFSKAFHLAPGPMAILDLDGLRIMDVNAAFTTATGWRREELIGRAEAELDRWNPAARLEDFSRQLREQGHLRDVEVQLRGKDGISGDFLMSAETVEINDTPCVLSLMVDITERKAMENELLAAVDSVMRDTSWLSQKIVERMAAITGTPGRTSRTPEISALPERMREVLALVAQGLPDSEIATRLGIAKNTVRNHVSAIYERLGIRRRSAVIVWARERGLGAAAKPRTKPGKSPRRKVTSAKRTSS